MVRWPVTLITLVLFLSGCASSPTRRQPLVFGNNPVAVPTTTTDHNGGYYENDGPGDHPPVNLDAIPNAIPRPLPLKKSANTPYTVMGRLYVPETTLQPFVERGLASWYGRKYNGKRTSSGEIYNMYAMTAAHPTLPIPSFARVTNIANHRSIIVKINDRGPFLGNRIIDLSYTAAHKLGIIRHGSAMVAVRSIVSFTNHRTHTQARQILSRTMMAARAPLAEHHGTIYLQLGAFSGKNRAENFRAKIKRQLNTLSLAYNLSVTPLNGLFRVRVGPYASITDAQQAAHRIEFGLNIRPLMIKP